MPPGRFYALVVASYVLGALVTAYYLVRARTGGDLRSLESGTLGARNVGRVLGKGTGVAVAAIDLAKGAGIVLVARALGLEPVHGALAACAAVCGHVWPPQLGFRGGKGAAIAGGALIALDPTIAVWALIVLVAASLVARDTQRGGLAGFAAFPCLSFALRGASSLVWGECLLSVLVLFAHRGDLSFGSRTREAAP